MLHVWIIYLHEVKNGHIQGDMLVNIPYMEHLVWISRDMLFLLMGLPEKIR